MKRRHLKIILAKCPFTLFINPELDESITIDEMTTDVRSNSKTRGMSFPWTHHHSCLPAPTGQGPSARYHMQFLPGNTGCG